MSVQVRRIAVNTGGGDAPGLNAVIRSVVLAATGRGWDVLGIQRGYAGLLDTNRIVQLDAKSVRGITHLGGTILGTTNKGDPFGYPVTLPGQPTTLVDRSDEVVANVRRLGIDALIAIGGDGSMRIASRFAAKGVPIVGVPKTIDNDLTGTVATFGFDTAVTVATEAIDRLHSTAEAHERVMVVEVMGRYAGWIALNSGVAATADVILIPEIPFDIERVCDKILDREARGRRFSIVVVAEGARPVDGAMVTRGEELGREVRLGGIGEQVAAAIEERTGKETRTVVLGHIQRGGRPTTFDRLLALRFGAAAVRLIEQGVFNHMVALDPPVVRAVPLAEATSRMKTVPLDSDTVMTARDLGISFGDGA
ncbi:MAG: ATP-dependent 6-phosphofructokinase [Thermoanaerobaculales bacterium]|jgi:6-phosphofructokinase 1|nr:ATP-dependent 6-phosphofructokinase [Thermoanaerobaculales bacterium]